MNRYVEERLEAIRGALKIRAFPDQADLRRLVEWLGANIVLRHAEVPGPYSLARPAGGYTVTLPFGDGWKILDHRAVHEIGHVLTCAGLGQLLRALDPDSFAIERLARCSAAKDEALANYFTRAWFLPSASVYYHTDDDLSHAARVSREIVWQRRRDLRGEWLRLLAPPQWAAVMEWHAVAQRRDSSVSLSVSRRGRAESLFSFPVTPESLDEDARQVNSDLRALTSHEFRLKYANFGGQSQSQEAA